MKTCAKCKIEKSASEFSKHRGRKDGLQSICKPCDREASSRWYKENSERQRGNARRWREENHERKLEYTRRWHEKNPHRDGLKCAIRRSPLPEHDLFEGASRGEVMAETAFDYRLCRLISEKTGVPHEIDHIHMIKDGGVHRLHNLRIITLYENRRRGDHSADGFDLEDYLTDEDIDRLDIEAMDFAA